MDSDQSVINANMLHVQVKITPLSANFSSAKTFQPVMKS